MKLLLTLLSAYACCACSAQLIFKYDTIEKELAPEIEIYKFEFPFETNGAAEIKNISIDCSCTQIESPKEGDKFDAGAKGRLKGTFNTASKEATYIGKIKLGTDKGDKVLTIKFKVNKLVTLGRLTSFLGTKKEDEIRIKTYYPSSPENFEVSTTDNISAEIKKTGNDDNSFILSLKNSGSLKKREKITLAYVRDGKRREFTIHAMPF